MSASNREQKLPLTAGSARQPGTWAAVLSYSTAVEARDVAQRVVNQLMDELATQPRGSVNWRLINGLAGFALVFDYARRCGLDVPPDFSAHLVLDGIRSAGNHSDASLFFGLAGLAWAGEVTDAWAVLGDDLASEFDQQLAGLLRKPLPRHAHSLFRGLSGLGVYALARARRTGVENAAMIVRRLEELATRDARGTTWATDSRQMRSPAGGAKWFSMGMPQGLVAVVAFLANAAQSGILGARELLHSSARWLHAQRMSTQGGQCFPIGIEDRRRIPPQRLAWCNGDLPVALALLQAGIAANEQAWIDTAADVACRAAALPMVESLECSLCHGDAGIGFCFAYFYNVLGVPTLAMAAERWFARTLRRRERGQRYEGYVTLLERPWGAPADFKLRWTSSGQFLRGAGGIALALLAGGTASPPAWAGALMLPWETPRD